MKKLLIFGLLLFVLGTAADARVLEYDWYKSMNGLWSVNLGLHAYRPDENNMDDFKLLFDGGIKYWPHNNWALELRYGWWQNDYTNAANVSGDVDVYPLTIGANYYFNEIFDRTKGYVGAAIGHYSVTVDPNNAGSSTEGEFGGNICGGFEYFWADNFSFDFRGTYHFASVEVAGWDVELNGPQIGGYFNFYF